MAAGEMAPFFWGAGGQRKTAEEIAREREIAQALMQSGADTSPVGHWTQGAARMASALAGVVRDRRAMGAQAENDAASRANIGSMLNLLGGSTPAPVAPVAAAPSTNPGAAALAPSSAPVASVPTGDTAQYIRTGLINRGLPEHVADAFVVNMRDESGLNPGINEAKPLVPGSRGGYGLYQLTGPRRRAYEAFAAERGADLGSIDPQLDFLMSELQGPEARAARSILSAPDTATAATAIVNDFLRPAESHRAKRASQYARLGGAPAAVQPAMAPDSDMQALAFAEPISATMEAPLPQAAPMDPRMAIAGALIDPSRPGEVQSARGFAVQQQMAREGAANPVLAALMGGGATSAPAPVQMAQSGSVAPIGQTATVSGAPQAGGINPIILQALTSPTASKQEREIAGLLLNRHLEQNDPMRQLQMQKAQLEIEAARNPARKTTTVGNRLIDQNTGEVIQQYEDPLKPTSDIQEYEFARQQGYQGTFADYQQSMRKAGAASTNVNVGEGDKFYEALDKKNAETFGALSETGVQARSKLALVDRLEGLLANAQTGGLAAIKQMAGEYGIKTDGLEDIQAAQALINELVPQQRQPGSGPMSDADLALFKQSLPRLINQEGGNQTIINTMRGITQYQIRMGEIADAVADRELSLPEARKAIREMENPLDALKGQMKQSPGGERPGSEMPMSGTPDADGWVTMPGGVRVRPARAGN